ncbi:hypothetical protein E4U41_002007, partial [Claviceps citrina]
DGSPATATQTGWPWVASASPVGGSIIPDGWYMTPSGKIMRSASSAASSAVGSPSAAAALLCPLALAVLALFGRW